MAIHAPNEEMFDQYNRPKVTKLKYWRYRPLKDCIAKEAGVVLDIIGFNTPKDKDGTAIPQRAVKVILDGFLDKAQRDLAIKEGLAADHAHEFLIVNWVEEIEHKRDMTQVEKRQIYIKGKSEEDQKFLDGISYEKLFEVFTSGMTPEEIKEAGNMNYAQLRSAYLTGNMARHTAVKDSVLNAMKWPKVTEKIEYVEHNDFDEFSKVIGTDIEAATAYKLLKANPAHANFFTGTEDV